MEPSQAPPASTTTLWRGLRARGGNVGGPSARDIFDLVRTYAKTRFHSLVLVHLNRLYVSLRGHLSDQIREVGFCRQRLGELQGLVQPADLREQNLVAHAGERILYPAGCLDLKDAIERLNQAITPED